MSYTKNQAKTKTCSVPWSICFSLAAFGHYSVSEPCPCLDVQKYQTPTYGVTATLIIKDENKGVDNSKMVESMNPFDSKKSSRMR